RAAVASPAPDSLLLRASRDHRDPAPFPTRRSSDSHVGEVAADRLGQVDTELVAVPAQQRVGGRHRGRQRRRGRRVRMRLDRISQDRKSTRLNSSHVSISYAVFCLKKKKTEAETALY